ncbi:NADPH-dependent FMN reductase [Thalassotalea aquiviva]|uniref:NADPH-dependent FMN reductase n=1 Tax=Thalassotalea aquiviva TaxID=3242415 RepID=UPI00352BA247
MKVLAFAASNNPNSINAQLALFAASLVNNAEIETLNIHDYELPLFSHEREDELGQPELAKNFFAKIGQADAIIISFAEHNGSYTAAFKNLFDWTSRIDRNVYQDKPVLMLATSPGPGGAQNVLASAVTSAPYFAAKVKGSLSLPNFFDNFDQQTQTITNDDFLAQLKVQVDQLTKP